MALWPPSLPRRQQASRQPLVHLWISLSLLLPPPSRHASGGEMGGLPSRSPVSLAGLCDRRLRSRTPSERDRSGRRAELGGVGGAAVGPPFERLPPGKSPRFQAVRTPCPRRDQPLSRPHHRRPHRYHLFFISHQFFLFSISPFESP